MLYVSPQVDAKTATVLVRVSVPPESGLRSGQFVHVRVITEERAGKLAVPREAVYTDHDGQSTLSIVEGDVAKQRTVKAGLRDGDLVEVEGDGVTEGATVVTLGSYALPKETKVRILNQERGGEMSEATGNPAGAPGGSGIGAFAIRHRLAIIFITLAVCLGGVYSRAADAVVGVPGNGVSALRHPD